jgi:hypothetical protein
LVEILVYVSYSLYLEAYVMRDSQVQMIQQHFPEEPTISVKPTNEKTGLFGWLKKQYHHHTSLPSPPPSVHGEKIVPAKKRLNPLNTVIKRGLSLNNLNKRASPIDLTEDHDLKQEDPHRFLKLKKKIEHAVVSASPDCHFPYPILLNRLEIEEDMILEQKRLLSIHHDTDDTIYPVTPLTEPSIKQARRRSSLMSFTFKRNSLPLDNPTFDIPPLPQSTTAYSSIRLPSLLADSKRGLEHLLLDTTSLQSFMKHQSITIGFTCYPIGCPDRPCLGPFMSTIDYFRYRSPENTTTIFPHVDQTLAHTIQHWCSQSQSSCQIHIDEQVQFIPGLLVESPAPITRPELAEHLIKASDSSILTLASPLLSRSSTPVHRHCSKFHGCNQPLIDHVFSFSHGIGKINVYTSAEPLCLIHSKDKITTWIACSLCDAFTAPIALNEQTASFSFGKYLELLFYNTKLSLIEPFCQHTQKKDAYIKSIIVRCFMYNGIVIKFMYEDTKYYELRIPRIQLGTDVVSFEKLSPTAPRIHITLLSQWKNQCATMDVDLFFQSVRTHLDLLVHYANAENRRKTRGQQPDAVKQLQAEFKLFENEMKALSQRLEADHQAILHTLSETSINELNDFRRYFAIQSASMIDYLTVWQQKHCPEVTDTCNWESPDYINKNDTHCFPGSSVLVREDEPTSIIAYTLSSNDYIQEIVYDESMTEDNSSSKNVSMPSLATSTHSTADSSRMNEPLPPLPANATTTKDHKKKALPVLNQHSPSNIIDGYYSSIERKYIAPSTGSGTETASFRTMVLEVVKSSVDLNGNTKRLEDLKTRLSPWTRKQEETKLEHGQEKSLKRQLTERTLKPLTAVQQETKEVQVSSSFYSAVNHGKNISPHIKHSKYLSFFFFLQLVLLILNYIRICARRYRVYMHCVLRQGV